MYIIGNGRSGESHAGGRSIGVIVLIGATANLLMIRHAVWTWVIGLAEILPAACLGASLARGGDRGREPADRLDANLK